MIEASLVLHEARIGPGLATICHTDRLYASARGPLSKREKIASRWV